MAEFLNNCNLDIDVHNVLVVHNYNNSISKQVCVDLELVEQFLDGGKKKVIFNTKIHLFLHINFALNYIKKNFFSDIQLLGFQDYL